MRIAAMMLLTVVAVGCAKESALETLGVEECEGYLINKLRSPSSYKRIDSVSIAKDEKTLLVSIEYDAQNSFGAVIRGRQFCNFPIVGGRAQTDGYIDHDAIAGPSPRVAE